MSSRHDADAARFHTICKALDVTPLSTHSPSSVPELRERDGLSNLYTCTSWCTIHTHNTSCIIRTHNPRAQAQTSSVIFFAFTRDDSIATMSNSRICRSGFLLMVVILSVGVPFADSRQIVIVHADDSDLPDFEKSVQFLESETQKLRFPHVEDIQSVVCQSCMDISTSAERVLLDPHTRNSVIEYVNGSLCRNLPLHQEECQNLAATYVPNLMDAMQFYAAPTKLCGETKLCPSSAILPQYDERICKMCRVLAEEALIYAQDCKTEMEILDVFHAQCEKFGIFAPKCHMLVDTFAPYYIGKLNSLTAEEVCQKAQMCEPLCIKDPSSCATCQFLVFQLKLKFQNPAVQEKLLHTLIEQCEKVPVHVDQCKDIVKRYGPYIFENLDSLLKPELVCEEIHACEGKKKIAEGMRVQLPDAQYGNVAYH